MSYTSDSPPSEPATVDEDRDAGRDLVINTPVPLFVCRSCRPQGWIESGPRPGTLLVSEVERVVRARGLQGQIAVLPIHCLAHCAHSCSAAVLPHDGRRVTFDDLPPDAKTAEALVRVALAVQHDGRAGAELARCPETLCAHRREA